MRYIETLNPTEIQKLQTILHDGTKHRQRMRAQALLLSHKGYKLKLIADICQVDRDTISQWFRRWEQNKFASLSDAPRSGRPSSLTQREKKAYSPT
ncbi:MAG: helix-turn-helix domain-containing protein [Tunicatimonas sp.]|uniref:helix-turn-helix domain-containing protein n=1 Tax=Tunicatimonas sp. TaxID=1940096 RepID=UPI003C729ECD